MDIKNNIKIIPVASPIYSPALLALGVLPLLSVRIEGLTSASVHNVSINIFGLSKAGFFMERTPAFSGEVIADKDNGSICFNLTSVQYRVRGEFFRTLKTTSPGKITVEVTIDGTKYMGDTPIMLFPANIYPATATPEIFSTLLSPFGSQVRRITENADGKSLLALYDAVRSERIIYSVRESDFISRNVAFDDVETFYARRSKMASPLEMALIFCSCALNMGLSPVIVTLKGKKAPSLLCGVTSHVGCFGTVSSSAEKLRELLSEGTIELFNISCLFTGHSVELEDAARSAYDELFSSEMLFALDMVSSYANGASLCHFDEVNTEAEIRFTEEVRKRNVKTKKQMTLSDHAEHLTDTAASPLLNIARNHNDFVCVDASGFSSVIKCAHSGEELALSDIANSTGAVGGMGEIYEVCRRLRTKNGSKGEIYLACGFLSYRGTIAPLALYPITLICKNGEVSVKFSSPKPYCNRLLCEKLKNIAACKGFFDNIGIPGGDLDDLISCFESLCATVPGGFKLLKECGVGIFPYRNSVISFTIVDRFDKINKDSLSGAILSGKASSDTDDSVPFGKTKYDIELRSPFIFGNTVLDAASHASCKDILVTGATGECARDIAIAVASENIRIGKTTLIISDSASEREHISKGFDAAGLSCAHLTLSADTDIKGAISKKLTQLSEQELPKIPETDKNELVSLQEKLKRYSSSKSKKYDFDFSFDDAARAYINAGKGLTPEQKNIHIEPDAIFFPDLSRKSAGEIFEAQMKLCRAASALPKMPYKENPFYRAALTDEIEDTATFRYFADKALCELSELIENTKSISEASGFELSHIKTLPALHAFLSLLVLISKEYDSGITSALLSQDAYSVSKKLAELRNISSKISLDEKELCEFDREIYTLCADELLKEWNGNEGKHSEITKTINAYRTQQPEEGKEKKSVFEVLGILHSYAVQKSEFDAQSAGMNEIFAGYWNGTGTDWKKVTSLVDFTKMADVLLKKIYGTDTEKRRDATARFPVLSEYCSGKTAIAAVIGAASLFDKMFSDDGSIVKIAEKLSADLYNMSFENGIFENGGICDTVSGWSAAAEMIPYAANYNKCVTECKKLGLSSFVHYLENNAYTPETEKIFTRSLLFLAIKQITLYDKNFLSMNLYEKDLERYFELLSELCEYNKKELAHIYIDACVSYIKANSVRAKAFSECLADRRFTAEELILRNSETVRNIFPIIIAEPSYAAMAGEVENMIICSADTLDTSKVLPVLHCGRHKAVISGSEKLLCATESFASDCRMAGLFEISAPIDSINGISGALNISHMRSPVSSYDKERNTNVLEAQTIGLEIMKELATYPDHKIQVLTFTDEQCEAVYEVLSAVSEKSAIVQKALSNRNINISCASKNTSGNCDVLYISPVFDRDETTGMCISCGEYDSPENEISGLPVNAVRAISGGAKKTVVCTSPAPSKYPNPTGAIGASRLALFTEYAIVGGNFADPEGELYDAYTLEFAALMSENGFEVYSAALGSCAAVRIGKDYYAAVIGFDSHAPIYKAKALKALGLIPMFIDTTELLLNPNKVIDRVRSIKDGGDAI